ncbi:flagellar basal-body rod protein FlgG [Ferrovibrio terrae]|uniref:Flagellar basal-body rod protein FlgG n=1 Tax=Ferrovibrio terrae TaxID=2594003 RepID=A0A516H6Q1_9PROT|nr:flagellar basal-body rod protein FlgG [Ferrovibrio terrae]QDO99401.1 flagellar basal-body rod protein FlgG [Ferrovibrio terrae]
MRSLSTGATGMMAQQLNVEVISNNIANMSTTAFKRQRAEFQDLLYQNMRRPGSTSSDANTIVPSGIQVGVGVRTAGVYRINEQGNLNSTGNTYDLAISGKGYFQITLPSGETSYTRAGSFQINAQGQIVTVDGYQISPAITVPQGALSVNIDATGVVEARIAGQTNAQNLGQIQLATFVNEAGLEATGDNLFLETAASGQATVGNPNAVGFGVLRQGYVETSNVNPVQEITNLITAQRAYEMNSKIITASDEMLQTATRLR